MVTLPRFAAACAVAILLTTLLVVCLDDGYPAWKLISRTVARAPAATDESGRNVESPFDLENLTIPRNEIRAGGPAKDAIPALSEPQFTLAHESSLSDNNRVVGVSSGVESRAYPLRILNYHEVVNDTLDSIPIAVTYCPLCDSAVVFDRRVDEDIHEFGVSGMLYNSNVLLYDRSNERESLWSQMLTRGVSSYGAGKSLKTVPFELTTWGSWRKRFPQTMALSFDTGHERDYGRNPYAFYASDPFQLMFPVTPISDRLPHSERVLGVWTETTSRAYAVSALAKTEGKLTDVLDGKTLIVAYDTQGDTVRVVEAHEDLQWCYSFWFAWYAFHPATELYQK